MNNKQRIWQVVHLVPKGKVASYGQIARLAGLPGYARYVGHTMKKLPSGTKLPWFRIVNSHGRLSFGPGTEQYLLQKSLLEKEGIVFVKGKCSMSKFGWAQGVE